ncbi:hypothetical protein KFE94_08965 [bacterium SCSIO 12643]|nr:hypothetical protein KFE94_08965 [bacterium SCSIO 12643]
MKSWISGWYIGLASKLKVTLVFFFIAAVLGLSMRLMHAGWISIHFKNILHTHSHIALLGWLYNVALIVLQYVIFRKTNSKIDLAFWLSQITFLGMMFSFPFQGYAAISITFSTLYLFCTYYLVYVLYRETQNLENRYVAKLIRWSGIYLIFSSIGPYALGFIMAKGLADTHWYKLTIYWFLHFLYNGFFLLVVYAFVFDQLRGLKYSKQVFKWMNLSIIPSFALSVLWLEPHTIWYFIALIAAILQLLVLGLLIKQKEIVQFWKNSWAQKVFIFSVLAYTLKVVFQVTAVLPAIQTFLMETVSYAVIGFIHLVMLGFFTLFFLAVLIEKQWLQMTPFNKVGLSLLIIGIIGSEILLFGQSIVVYFEVLQIPEYFQMLMAISTLMPIGIGLMMVEVLRNKV